MERKVFWFSSEQWNVPLPPATAFMVEDPVGRLGSSHDSDDPYLAVLACPKCGMPNSITANQLLGLTPISCGMDGCNTEFVLQEGDTIYILSQKPS